MTEREGVKAYVGTVAVVGDPKDQSTKSLIEKILASARLDFFVKLVGWVLMWLIAVSCQLSAEMA